MMLIKKKKLLNVRYKRTPKSKRLLDKQFSFNDEDRFRISIKERVFSFMRPDGQSGYQITNGKTIRGTLIGYGKSVRVDHPDGTAIYFTLHEDFLYALDYDKWTYGAIALCVNIAFFALLQLMMPMMGTELVVLKQAKQFKQHEQRQRVSNLLKKIERKNQVLRLKQ